MTSEIAALAADLLGRLMRIPSDRDAGRWDRILSSVDEGLRLCEHAPADPEGVIDAAEGSLAANGFVAARHSGDLARAFEYAKRECAVAGRRGSPAVRVRALNNRGLAYHELNQLVAAEADYRAALRVIDENPSDEAAASLRATVLSHLGQVLTTRGQSEEAAALLERAAIPALGSFHFTQVFDADLARDNDRATVYANSGEYAKAEAVLRDAIARAAGADPQIVGILVCNLAEILHRAGRIDQAIETYGKAVELHRSAPGCSIELATDYVNLAAIYTETGNRERAVECYKNSWDAARQTNPRSLVSLYALRGIALMRTTQHDYDRARAAVERGLDLYEEMRPEVAITEAGHAGFLAAYRNLLELGMYLALHQSWPDELRALIDRAKARFALERLARTDDHAAFAQNRRDADSIAGINGVVLDFFVGPNATFISYQHNKSLGAARADVGEAELSDMVNAFREELLSSSRRAREGLAAARLSRALFEKVSLSFSRVRQIYWMPDGPLWYAPLEALPVAGPDAPSEATIFGALAPTCYAPSVSALAALRTRRIESPPRDSWNLIAFGEPQNDAAFAPLNGTAKELDALEQLARGRFRIALRRAAHATRENFVALAPSATHIHIAAHAVADFESEQPYIVFSGSGERQFLRTGELAALGLKADVVFLSACSTSVGRSSTGEGVMSLARAFLWSGCRCVVASLWPVPDDSAPLMVESFYAGLVAGLSPARAAQHAREQHRAAGVSPRSWAGFQVLGDGDTWSDRFSLRNINAETA